MMRSRLLSGIAVVLALVSTADMAAARTRAVLVGVSRYPTLDAQMQLQGPRNDVQQYRDLLLARRAGFFRDAHQRRLHRLLLRAKPRDSSRDAASAIYGECELVGKIIFRIKSLK